MAKKQRTIVGSPLTPTLLKELDALNKLPFTPQDFKPDGNWVSRFFSRLVPTERYSISSKVIGWGEVPDSAYWYALSLANLAEDNYDLVITIKDARSGQQVSKMVAFTVLEP